MGIVLQNQNANRRDPDKISPFQLSQGGHTLGEQHLRGALPVLTASNGIYTRHMYR